MDDEIGIAKAALFLGRSRSRVYQYCREGRLGRWLDGRYVISKRELVLFTKIPRRTGRPPGREKNPD